MLAQEGQDVAFEGDGEGRWGGGGRGFRGGVRGRAVPGDDAQGREQDAPPVVARAFAQDDLESVVGARGEQGPVIGPVGEGADAQKELGPVGHARGGKDGLAPIQQGRPVVEDEGTGVVVGGGGLEEGQQGVPDPELHGLVLGTVAVSQDVEAEHLRRRVGPGREQGQQDQERQGGEEKQDRSFHGDSMAKGEGRQTLS